MNLSKLKSYAPQARRDFIQAMTDRAAFYGLAETKTEPMTIRGDVAVIRGRERTGQISDTLIAIMFGGTSCGEEASVSVDWKMSYRLISAWSAC